MTPLPPKPTVVPAAPDWFLLEPRNGGGLWVNAIIAWLVSVEPDTTGEVWLATPVPITIKGAHPLHHVERYAIQSPAGEITMWMGDTPFANTAELDEFWRTEHIFKKDKVMM